MTALRWMLRLALGGLFLYAGLTKIYPPEHRHLFEIALSSYRILPVAGVIAVGVVLPWLEIVLGGLLISGWRLRYTASFASLLLLIFLSIMASTYFRGIQADCGCFGFGESLSRYTLIRDGALLLSMMLLAGQDWWAARSTGNRALTS